MRERVARAPGFPELVASGDEEPARHRALWGGGSNRQKGRGYCVFGSATKSGIRRVVFA